ncbi:MAG: indole-3-glycerol phosphate synthase TrpC [Actinomycetota bacterium]|nr:indole-3-glycerol phosphate synthase TrpC [Actinomycetota bacterium]
MSYLEKILESHRLESQNDNRSFELLYDKAVDAEPTRGFVDSLKSSQKGEIAVIAEIKKKSPSKGELASNLDPASLANEYEKGGAAAISVLTDENNFAGSKEDLIAAAKEVKLPILRKDFTVDLKDICDTRIMGADAVLLIVSALDQVELKDFLDLSIELDLDPLVEVHDEKELERALAVDAKLIGVNQRDLKSFEVDPLKAINLISEIPANVTSVAESGIDSARSASALREAGYAALLVGELLVKSADRAKTLSELRNIPV